MMIMHHFFQDLPKWLNEMSNPRHPSYITYIQADLALMGLMKNVCAEKTMHSMEESFNEEECIRTLRPMSGDRDLEEMPHCDTLNYYLEKLSPACPAEVRRKMVKSLIRMKSFNKARLLGKYWRVIIDGTGLFYFKEKHCGNCLVKTIENEDGTKEKRYCHKVLEAKLVLSDKIVVSLDTEFIENENGEVTKNDCEINAAKRLMARLKKNYPRLPVCIQGDALYEAEPVMRICRENGWKYIFSHNENRQPVLSKNYEWICKGDVAWIKNAGEEKGTGRYVNHVEQTAEKYIRIKV